MLQSGSKQGLLGVLQSALIQEPAIHPASELPKLFATQPFTIPEVQPYDLSKTDSLGVDIDQEIGKFTSAASCFRVTDEARCRMLADMI